MSSSSYSRTGESFRPLDAKEVHALLVWGQEQAEKTRTSEGPFRALFSPKFRLYTWAIVLLRVAINFTQYQLLLILPTIVTAQHSGSGGVDNEAFGESTLIPALK